MNFLGVVLSTAVVEFTAAPAVPGFCVPAPLDRLVELRFVEERFEPPKTVDLVGLPVRPALEFHPVLGPSSFVGLEERDDPLDPPPAPNLGGLARRLGVLSLSWLSSAERAALFAWLLLKAMLVVLDRLMALPPPPPPPERSPPEELPPPFKDGDGRVIRFVGLAESGGPSSEIPIPLLILGEAGLVELKLNSLPVLMDGSPDSCCPRSMEDGFTPGAEGKGRPFVGEVEEDDPGNFPSLCICWIC